MSTDSDRIIAARENKQYKMKYNAENASKLTVVEKEAINLPNVAIRADLRKNGP